MPRIRWRAVALAATCACLVARGHADARSQTAPGAPSPADALASRPDLPPEQRALVVVGGAERWVDAAAAQAAGYTLVDLGDEWTPYIFQEVTDGNGNLMANRYRQVYLGLANDIGDRDGQPLPEGEHNYLELFGIPPTLSVLRARFVDDVARQESCKDVDFEKLKTASSIPPRAGKVQAKFEAKVAATAKKLEAMRVAAGVETLDELAQKNPKVQKDVALVERYSNQRVSFPEVEKRLTCEGLLAPPPPNAKPAEIDQPGQFDEPMREAVIRFQHKHMLYDAAALRPDTMAALGRPLVDNDYAALVRVLTERIVSAANILEDGSVDTKKGPPLYLERQRPDAAGAQPRRRGAQGDLDAARSRHAGKGARLLPAPPGGGAKDAARRGQAAARARVPLAADGSVGGDRSRRRHLRPACSTRTASRRKQVRHHFPMLTLRVKYNDKWIPLIRWRTTIGGWRSDLASNGYEYFRYKGVRRGAARVAQRRLRAGVDRADVDADPHARQVEARARRRAAGRQLRRGRARLSLGVRPRRRLQRRARQERPARLGQRCARARLVGDPVDPQPRRLFARLSSPDEPSGGAAVLVRAAASAGRRRG